MSKHIAVLSNPRAGKGRGRSAAEAAIAVLQARGAEVRAYAGSSAAETVALAGLALREDPALLVIVGGDGTLSAILDPVLDGEVPLALVPAGTGNDLARALGIPRDDPAAAALIALTGVAQTIDIGAVHSGGNTKHFLTVAALGFDAKVSDRTNRLRWPHGVLRYYLALIIELLRLRPVAFTTAIDDESAARAPGTLIAVGNTASYGGGIPICRGADPRDGLLDIVHVAPLKRLQLLRLFPLLLRGEHLSRAEVSHRRASRIRVTAPDLRVYADGEFVGANDCTISAHAARLKMMVPRQIDEQETP